MKKEFLRNVLEKLRVKSGLRGESAHLDGPWRVGFFYDRNESSFTLTLYYNTRSKTILLNRNDVETRGRSNWLADNTWRLSKSGLEKGETILKAVEVTKMRQPK